MGTNQIKRLQQKGMFGVDYLRNISVKVLSKYLQWDSNKCQFSFFPIISQPEFLSDWDKKHYGSLPSLDVVCEIW